MVSLARKMFEAVKEEIGRKLGLIMEEDPIVASMAVGALGGTLLIRDSSVFSKIEFFYASHFISVIGNWHGVNEKVALINIYEPQGSRNKEELWRDLLDIINFTVAVLTLLREFNDVRSRNERFGSLFINRDATAFNKFIANGGLHDFPLGGRRFTRYNREGSKLSKFDRFLVSNNFFSLWKDAKVKTLAREISDHCPIMLSVDSMNFGPKCFKFFNHWMEDDDFNNIVKTSWEAGVYRGFADIVLKNKLKKLKSDVKVGWNIKSQESNRRKLEIQSFLADWNSKAKSGLLSSYDRHKRDEFLMDLHILNQKKRESLKQKSRVK
ncbi:cytochrome P450 [Tanacetum coccineum]